MHSIFHGTALSALGIALVSTTLVGPVQPPSPRATIKDVGWIEGTWSSTSGTRTVEERWTPPAGGAMLAVSRTLKGDRLVEFEYLRIVEREGTLVYIAQPGGRPPTEFRLTNIEGKTVTFENPAHDFPKAIAYTARPDGSLEVSISGEGGQRKQSWDFERK
jgi:hypothetical protein